MKLRTRVLVTAVLSVSIIITVAFAATAALDLLSHRDELASQANTTAAIMAQGLTAPMWESNERDIREMIAGLAHHPDFANASVMDENGKVLVSLTMPDTVQDGTLGADSPIMMEANGRHQVLGTIEVQMTTRSLWTYGQRQLVILLGTLAATAAAVAVAISLAFRLMGAPLERIATAAIRLGAGEHEQPVSDQDRRDEIGNIARAIEMSRRQMATIEQMRLDQASYLHIVFANAVDGIILADADGHIESFNPGAERIFWLGREQASGMTLAALLPDLQIGADTTSVAAETEGARCDGSRIPLSVSLSRFTVGDSSMLSVVAHDISVHKEAERALIAARQAAEDASTTKSAFLANMSHEIRTPMNAIIGFTRLALDFDQPARLRGHLAKILTAAQGLLSIINDILDLSKIEVGKLAMETRPFQLDHLLNELADMFTLRAHEQKLELLFDVPSDLAATLVGDSLRLRQVLVNLVGNAIKFTEKGEVVVSVRHEPENGPGVHLRFMVRDTGIGMTEQQRLRVFDAFTQADASTTRRFGGTGLGLTISRHIVAMMGGEIGVNSVPGEGSTFWFTARFGLPAAQPKPAGAPVTPLPDGLRVLVVDDNQTALEILSNALISLRFDVSAVLSGAEALTLLNDSVAEGRVFDVVLTDYLMPRMDGIEVTRRVKHLEQLPSPPTVVMVTAQDRDEIAQRAWSAGVDAFLIKPVTPSQLLNTIQQVLGYAVTGHHHRSSAAAADAASLSNNRAHLAGVRLLLVEDNEINRELAMEILGHSNMRVDTAADGAEAIRMVQTKAYDAVLMDCQMPIMDGYAATRALRHDPRFKTLPIIAMTANAMAGDREDCLAAGMNDYIAKPFEEHDLIDMLLRWVRPALAPEGARRHAPQAARPADVEQRPPRTTHMDKAEGLRHASGNMALYQRLLDRFATQQGGFEEAFRRALTGQDKSEPGRLAHTLKGLAANLGAHALGAVAGELEKALRDGAVAAEVETHLVAVAAELREVLAELRTPPAVTRAPSPAPAGPLAPPEELATLAAALRDGDVDSGDHLTTLLERWPAMIPLLETVAPLVADYRFEEAAEVLAGVMESA